MELAEIEAVLEAEGLRSRGGFHPAADEPVPEAADGRPAGTLILAGALGGSLWPAFSGSSKFADGRPDPLDRWSRRVIEGLATRLGATAVFPFGGPPHWPFQAWARRAEPLSPSPLGILIHPEHGLWHSYRGALVFARRIELPVSEPVASPCESCAEKPCLAACPVAAFSPAGYDVVACRGHLSSGAAEPCFAGACLARRACPVGPASRYGEDQARFHMTAFHRAVAGRRPG